MERQGDYLDIGTLRWIIPTIPPGIKKELVEEVRAEIERVDVVFSGASKLSNYLNNFWEWIDFDVCEELGNKLKKLSSKKKFTPIRMAEERRSAKMRKIRKITDMVLDELQRTYPDYDPMQAFSKLGEEIHVVKDGGKRGGWDAIANVLFPVYVSLRSQGYEHGDLVD